MSPLVTLRSSHKLRASLFCLVLTIGAFICSPCFAADQPSVDAQLSRAEEIVFGKNSKGMPIEDRLTALESSVIEKKEKGASIKDRLAAVNKVLGVHVAPVVANKTATTSGKTAPTSGKTAVSAVKTTDRSIAASGIPGLTNKSTKDPSPAELPPVAPKAVMSTRELLQVGTKKFNQGDRLGAAVAFKQVLISDPHNVDAMYNLGAISEQRGDLVSALGLYKSALAEKPSDSDIQQAVASVEAQFSGRRAAGTPLIGGAQYAQSSPNVQLNAEVPQPAPQRQLFGLANSNNAALQNQFGGYPTLSAQIPQPAAQPQPRQQTQHSSVAKNTIINGLHYGLMSVPFTGGAACPICGLLNRL